MPVSDALQDRDLDATPAAQAVAIAFRFLGVAMVVAAGLYMASGITQIEPGNRAIILTLGTVSDVHGSGLVWSWPRPIGEVIRMPGSDVQLRQSIERLDLHIPTGLASSPSVASAAAAPSGAAEASGEDITIPNPAAEAPPSLDPAASGEASGDAAPTAPSPAFVDANAGIDPLVDGSVLTGDGMVVHVRGTVIYTVADPVAYWQAGDRLANAIEREWSAATIAVCAGRSLDGVMVARPDTDQGAANGEERDRLRGDIMQRLRQRLDGLGLGIAITRIDLATILPPQARAAFEGVLSAEVLAQRDIDQAQTEAVTLTQDAASERNRRLREAEAHAREVVAQAHADTDQIVRIARHPSAELPGIVSQIYRDRMRTILQQAESVVLVDPHAAGSVLIPAEPQQ